MYVTTEDSTKGKRSKGMTKGRKLIFLMMLGIFAGCLFQPVRSEAEGLSNTIQVEDEIPYDIQSYCEEIGGMFDICPELLESMAYTESRFIPKAKSVMALCKSM